MAQQYQSHTLFRIPQFSPLHSGLFNVFNLAFSILKATAHNAVVSYPFKVGQPVFLHWRNHAARFPFHLNP